MRAAGWKAPPRTRQPRPTPASLAAGDGDRPRPRPGPLESDQTSSMERCVVRRSKHHALPRRWPRRCTRFGEPPRRSPTPVNEVESSSRATDSGLGQSGELPPRRSTHGSGLFEPGLKFCWPSSPTTSLTGCVWERGGADPLPRPPPRARHLPDAGRGAAPRDRAACWPLERRVHRRHLQRTSGTGRRGLLRGLRSCSQPFLRPESARTPTRSHGAALTSLSKTNACAG